jgi:hypothetical protein
VYRAVLIAAAIVGILFVGTVGVVGVAIWQVLTAPPQPTALVQVTPKTATATRLAPTFTPSPLPSPTLVPTDTPEPTATPSLRYLDPNTKISVGMYVKAVKPEGVNLRKTAGFDGAFVATIGQGAILYVLGGPVRADNLLWIRMRDNRTGYVGWDRQDNVVAFAVPIATPTP